MAVFVCCADESTDGRQETDFFYGGFAATVDAWENDFAPAWIARVLQGPPPLEYLHVSALTNAGWRQKHGIKAWDADQRLTEASRVIGSCGSLIPILAHMSQERFKRDILPFAPRKGHTALEQPDYIAFLAFSFTTLLWLRTYRRDEVEKVDFWVEENGKISTRMGRMHDKIAADLVELGHPDLADLVGTFLPVPKERIPAQAADCICWHERNAKNGTLDRDGWRRRHRMTHNREGFRTDVDDVMMEELAKAVRNKLPRVRKAV